MSDEDEKDEPTLHMTPEGDAPEAEKDVEEEWTPPTKEEWAKLQRESKRAARDLAKYKEQATKGKSDEDVDAAVSKARQDVEAKYKSRVVKAEARAKLTAAGAKGDLVYLVRLIDMDDIDVDDDGEIDGLDEQIERLQDSVPDLFSKKTKAPAQLKGDAADKSAGSKTESSEDKLAKMLRFGRPA